MARVEEIKFYSDTIVAKKLSLIKQSFDHIPIERTPSGYPYSLFSLTDFKPPMTPELMEDMADLIIRAGNFTNADIIVSEADRGGGPLTHAVAVRAGLPYTLANWYPTGTQGEIQVTTSVGFSGDGIIYINGLSRGQRVILLDDLLSSGGTAIALLDGITKAGAIPLEALFVAEKLGIGGREKIREKYQIPVVSLVTFTAEGEFTQVIS